MLILVEGAAGSGKSQLTRDMIRAGEVDLVADVTQLWAATGLHERGPDGKYPIRSDGDPALEAASGARSRAFASAEVQAAGWACNCITPEFLQQVGRDLVRSGDSMHVIDMDALGRVTLLPCSSWHFEGSAHPDSWTVRATFYGPSTSTTRNLPFSGVVFCKWGSTPGQPYIGTGPLSWAHTTARLQSEVERSLAEFYSVSVRSRYRHSQPPKTA